MDYVQVEKTASLNLENPEINSPSRIVTNSKASTRIPKNAIRTSLRASTTDAVLATVFCLGTSGILLSNFLVELDASPIIFGMLSSIPMLVNIIQPLGAFLSERTTSRFQYSLSTFGISRLLWLILFIGIILFNWGQVNSQQLEILTLLIVLGTNLLGGLGGASWLSWIAAIVPRRLRGRYFGIRNSAASLTNLICMPLSGLAVSYWYGGTLQGYGVVLFVSIVFGVLGIGCQYFKVDINPQVQNNVVNLPQKDELVCPPSITPPEQNVLSSIWKNSNFLMFMFYFSFWMLAVNLSAPFFNLYMLDALKLDVSWVTFYGSLQAGATLVMLIYWGKLADKIGNLPILIFIGILVAITPLLWLGINNNQLSLWLWLPLLHIFTGATCAAIDLCSNNIQLGIAPVKNQSIYFAIASAASGFTGALGITIGSFIAQLVEHQGLVIVFAISGLLRLAALIPLFFVQEPQR